MSIVNPVNVTLEPPEMTNRLPMSCMSSVVAATPEPATKTLTGLSTEIIVVCTGAVRRYTPPSRAIVQQDDAEHFTNAAFSAAVQVPAAEHDAGMEISMLVAK